MPSPHLQRKATMKRDGAANLAKHILAASPMVPALLVNVDWFGVTPLGWKLAAIFGIVVASLFIEASRHARPWHTALLLLCAGLFGCYCNMLLAMKNASHASEDDLHLRKTHNLAVSTASSQSSQWSVERLAAIKVARGDGPPEDGLAPVGAIEAGRRALIDGPASRWTKSQQCTDISADASKRFCAEVAKFDGRIAGAEERDRLTVLLTPKDGKAPTAEKSEDPFAEDFPKFAAAFGVTVAKELATPHLNGVRAIWLELMAGLGYMAILLLWDLTAAAMRPRTRAVASTTASCRGEGGRAAGNHARGRACCRCKDAAQAAEGAEGGRHPASP